MILKDKLKEEPGFQYIIEGMELMSSVGRSQLLASSMETSSTAINAELDRVQTMKDLLCDPEMQHPLADLKHRLMELQDIQGTITHLQHRVVLDEIELYEIKNFSYICMGASRAAGTLHIDAMLSIPDLAPVFEILDPDHTRIPSFYIYDSYHPELAAVRKQMRALKDTDTEDAARFNELFNRQNDLQQEIITRLSDRLYPYAGLLSRALTQMGYADILLAKATQAHKWNLCRPQIQPFHKVTTRYEGLFNPRLQHHKLQQGLRYQPVDIEVSQGLCIITGANMAGKTVALKTMGIAQMMCQFGMFVPAVKAEVALVDDIIFCIGDEQNEMNGLSSFASEIIKISTTLQRSRSEHLLILIDEPARTTNPVEGKAIVQAISQILNSRDSISLITTHYSQLGIPCRKLRVKGFLEQMVSAPLTPENINLYMDYSLIPDQSEDVPLEALRIAAILGCDPDMISLAEEKLK